MVDLSASMQRVESFVYLSLSKATKVSQLHQALVEADNDLKDIGFQGLMALLMGNEVANPIPFVLVA